MMMVTDLGTPVRNNINWPPVAVQVECHLRTSGVIVFGTGDRYPSAR